MAAKKKIAQGGNGGSSSSSSAGAADEQAPSLWAFILGTFIHQIADNANKLVVPLVYLQITSVGVMSILTGVMTLLQTFGTLPAGRWSSMIGPKALIQWITLGRAILTTTLAIVFLFYSTGALPSGLTLFLVTLITSADWFIRGKGRPLRSFCCAPAAPQELSSLTLWCAWCVVLAKVLLIRRVTCSRWPTPRTARRCWMKSTSASSPSSNWVLSSVLSSRYLHRLPIGPPHEGPIRLTDLCHRRASFLLWAGASRSLCGCPLSSSCSTSW